MRMRTGKTAREERFWAHFDGRAQSWRDGYPDAESLAKMTAAAKARVEAELLDRLNRKPEADDWVLHALGELGSKTAVATLKRLLAPKTSGTIRVAAAAALWKIARSSEAVSVVTRILLGGRPTGKRPGLDSARIDAAVALGSIDTPASRVALAKALSDSDYLVASNAKSALRRLKTGKFDPWAEMVEEGWTMTKNPDGTITYTRPKPENPSK
jgi:HEAT repeat protein